MKIAIRSDLHAYLQRQVKQGRYRDLNQALNGALELARDQETLTPRDVEKLRREVQVGLDAADRGEFVEFSAEDVMAEGRAILARRKNGAGAGARKASRAKRRR